MQDEESLVRRAKDLDQVAFARLYEEYFDKIFRYIALRIGDRAEAEDMAQQVFLNAIHSISSYNITGAPFAAWLYRIAHNQVVDHLRKKTKEAALPLNELVVSEEHHLDPQSIAERSYSMEQVMKATKQLTDAQREVISLRFTSDLPINEVARIMGKSEGAIKALQHSAIAALRKSLLVE